MFRPASRTRFLILIALGGLTAAGPGCAGRQRPPPETPQPARAVVSGDWDDVEAAILTAAAALEVVVERFEPGEGVLRATLRTVRSEPVTVTARHVAGPGGDSEGEVGVGDLGGRDGGGGVAGGGQIELEAQFGRFAEPDSRARRLVEAIERRLRQLEGVDYAPLR